MSVRCPQCGAGVTESASGASLLVSCTRCPWQAATTNESSPPFDPQRYGVFASSTLPAREVAVRLAVVLGVSAKEMLAVASGAQPLATSVEAIEVQRLAGLLAPRSIAVQTVPPFPWELPGVGAT